MDDGPSDGDGSHSSRPRRADRGATDGERVSAEELIAAHRTSSSAPATHTHRHPFLNYIGHTIVAVLSIIVLVVTGVYWNISAQGAEGISKGSVNAGLGGGNSLVTAAQTPGAGAAAAAASQKYEPENFLLVGSDSRAGANNIDGAAAELAGISNTDSLMLLHISADRQRVSVISLPRDLWAENVPCQAYDASTNTYGGPVGAQYTQLHINAFYNVGGPKCLVDAVDKLTQLTVTRYVQIDFSGFAAMVDALGGVTVNACGPIIDGTLGTVLASGGQQTIDGAQALLLARAREVVGDSASDIARIHRQQLILSAILREVKSAGTLLDPAKLSAFVHAFTNNTTTAGVDFETLMALAESLGNLDPGRVTFYTLPTVPDDKDTTGRGSMYIDPSRADAILSALRNDQPVPGSADATTSSSAPTTSSATSTLSVAPADVDLGVVNATGTTGLGTAAGTALNDAGFDVNVDTDLEKVADSAVQSAITVEYAPGNEAAALTVASAVPGSTLVATEGLGSRVKLLLGTSYADKVTAVSVGDQVSSALLAQIPDGSAGNVIAPTDAAGTSSTETIAQVNAGDTSCL